MRDAFIDNALKNAGLKVLGAQLAEIATRAHTNDEFLYGDVDVDDAVCLKAVNRLTLPTYCEGADGEVVHPSIKYFKNKWNGYHYWMAMTPYKDTNSIYENPSILVSNDGQTWIVPPGVTNPIVPRPASGFNADPCLFMDTSNITMYMVYKYASTRKYTNILYTTDGVNWSAPVSITDSVDEYICPIVLWDSGAYVMWYLDAANSSVLTFRTATNPLGAWSDPTVCTVTMPADVTIWHYDIVKLNNQYHMIAHCNPTDATKKGLYFAKSNDGINWLMARKPLLTNTVSGGAWDTNSLYKAAMIPMIGDDGLRYALYYGSNTKFYIGYTEIFFKKNVLRNMHAAEISAAKNGLYPWILCDTFARADASAGLGVADSGQTWAKLNGELGLSGGKVYAPGTGYDGVYKIDIGKTDYYLSFEVPAWAVTSEVLIHFRRKESPLGYLRFGLSANCYGLFKYANSASSTIFKHKNPAAGDWLAVKCIGTKIQFFINGLLAYTHTETDLTTGTIIGVGLYGADGRLDNLIVRDIV
jgi:hypothetical protein